MKPTLPAVTPSAAVPRTRPRRLRGACLGLCLTLFLLTAGCVYTTEPVMNEGGATPDLEPFAGTWYSSYDYPYYVELQPSGNGSLAGVLRNNDPTILGEAITFTVRVADIGGQYVVSALMPKDRAIADVALWAVGQLSVGEDGRRLTFRQLDTSVMAAALTSGELEARKLEESGSSEYGPLLLEVSGAVLGQYLTEHPEAFADAGDGGEELILSRDRPEVRSSVATGVPFATDIANAPGDTGWAGYPPYQEYPPPWSSQAAVAPVAYATPTPFPGTGGAAAPGRDQPKVLDSLLLALVLALVAGVAGAAALDYIRRRRQAPEADTAAAAAVAVDWDADPAPADWGVRARSGWRRYVWPAVLILAVAVGPILYLTVLLEAVSLPEWAAGLRGGALAMLHGFAPYVLVFSIGALIGAAEVATTYPRFTVEALSTKWAAFLVFFNAFGSTLVYATVMSYTPALDHPLIRAVAIATGFAVLIRTRFFLARDLSGSPDGDGVSIDLGWPYGRLQQTCRQRIDRELLREPRCAMDRLLAAYPDTADLERVAAYAITRRDPDGTTDLPARLEAIRAEDIGPAVVRARLAAFIARVGGPELVTFLLEHTEPAAAVPPAGSPAPES